MTTNHADGPLADPDRPLGDPDRPLGGPPIGSGRVAARSSWLVAGAVVAVAIVAIALLSNGLGAPGAGASPTAAGAATPTADASMPAGTCAVADLQGRILRWEGAAGSQIATVTLRSSASIACRLMDYRLALVDGGGSGLALIVGIEVLPGITLAPGEEARTLIRVSNYCLAATPREPVSIRLDGPEESLVFLPAEDGSSGVPPCNGAGSPASISQQPWELTAG